MTPTPRTCSAEKLIRSPSPADPDVIHSLHARCAQPPGHRGLHEADDPFDPTNRIQWDGAGEMTPTRVPTAVQDAAIVLAGHQAVEIERLKRAAVEVGGHLGRLTKERDELRTYVSPAERRAAAKVWELAA